MRGYNITRAVLSVAGLSVAGFFAVAVSCLFAARSTAGSLTTVEQVALPSDTTDSWTVVLRYLGDEPDAELLELWQHWAEAPLNVNASTADELHRLPGLTLRQALHIVSYRGTHGPFGHIDSLVQVPTVSPETLLLVRPFAHVPANEPVTTDVPAWWRADWQGRMLLRTGRRIERARGYTGETQVPYLGSPYRSVARVRAWNPHLDVGLTADKRPGEPLLWDPERRQYGADHLIGYVHLRNRGRIRQVVAGSYQAAFGQGLALWTGPRFSSAYAPPSTLTRQGSGIRPYRGTSPHTYFRGAGASVRVTRSLEATAFASHRRRDATLDTLHHSEAVVARSLRTSSLRRTDTERQYRRLLSATHVGGHMQWRHRRLHIGVLGLYARFGHPIVPPARPDTRYAFAGRWTTHWGLAAQYSTMRNVVLFGETARTGPRGAATVLGVHAPVGRAGSVGLRGHAANRFYDPLDLGGLDGRSVAGERGITARLALPVHAYWTLYGTVQQTYVRVPQFRTTRPVVATRTAASVHYMPSRHFDLRVQGQWRTGDIRESVTHPYGPTVPVHGRRTQHNLRLHMQYAATPDLRFSVRTAATRVQLSDQSETGTLLWVETDYAPHRRISTNTRWTLFDTEGFESRLFAYEPDLQYGFSIPALFDQGQRAHALVRLNVSRALRVETRYSVSAFTTRDVIGQGRDTINSHRVRDWRVQLRWAL